MNSSIIGSSAAAYAPRGVAFQPSFVPQSSSQNAVSSTLDSGVSTFAPGPIAGTFVGPSGATIEDSAKTPGMVLTTSVADISQPGWASTHRNVPQSEKQQVKQLYGYTGPDSAVEYDHLVSLEIGGGNDVKNLWPEPIQEAHIKDKFESWLHGQIISGKLNILDAQKGIAGDWKGYAETVHAPASVLS